MSSRPTALVVVDHGSRNAASNASLDLVVRQVEETASGRYVAVLAAHMDLAAPSIADAVDAAVAAGAGFVVVAQYFLAPGRHSEEDIPRLVAEAVARHPGLDYVLTTALGPDPALSALVLQRAASAAASGRSLDAAGEYAGPDPAAARAASAETRTRR